MSEEYETLCERGHVMLGSPAGPQGSASPRRISLLTLVGAVVRRAAEDGYAVRLEDSVADDWGMRRLVTAHLEGPLRAYDADPAALWRADAETYYRKMRKTREEAIVPLADTPTMLEPLSRSDVIANTLRELARRDGRIARLRESDRWTERWIVVRRPKQQKVSNSARRSSDAT